MNTATVAGWVLHGLQGLREVRSLGPLTLARTQSKTGYELLRSPAPAQSPTLSIPLTVSTPSPQGEGLMEPYSLEYY